MRGSWVGWQGLVLLVSLVLAGGTGRAQDEPAPAPTRSPREPIAPAPAPTPPATVTALPVVEEPSYPPIWAVVAPRVGAGYMNGPGFGYSNGFTMLDAFVPMYGGSNERLVFLDARALISDNNAHLGGNLGAGYRYYNSGLDRIFGVWSSADVRDTGFNTYAQASGGVETIGRWVDFRSNVYVILGPQTTQTNAFYVNAPFFQGINIRAPFVVQTESALTGGEAEVGFPVPYVARYGVKAFCGPYAYHGDALGDVFGGQGRLQARISNNLDLNLQVRGDPVFGTTVSFGGAFRWGGVRRPYREPDRQSVFNRFADPIVRNYNISVAEATNTSYPLLTNPSTGLPIVVIHVDNTAPPGGDGSIQHPLNTLAPAPAFAGPNGIILVNYGNGTASGMNQGVTLLANQHLLGNSANYTFLSNELGVAPLPNTPTVGMPAITNTTGSAVILANGNEVAGFNIVAPAGSGIIGNNVTGFNIHDLSISNAAGNGILLQNAGGAGLISNVLVSGSAGDGLHLTTSGSTVLTAAIGSNTFSTNTGNGINLIASGSSQMTVVVSGGSLTNNGNDGIIATSTGSASMNLTVENATISGNAVAPVVATLGTAASSASQSASVTGNTITSTTNTGISITETGSGTLTATASNNTITVAAAGTAVNVSQTESGSGAATATISSNTASNLANGIVLAQSGSSSGSLTATVSSNTISNATTGIQTTQTETSSGAVSLTASSNTSSNLGGMTFTQTISGTSSVTTSLTSNTASSNVGSGILLTTNNTGTGSTTVSATGNTTSSNTAFGMNLQVTSSGTTSVTMSSNTAASNFSNGLVLNLPGTATNTTTTVSSNTATGNTGLGIQMLLSTSGTNTVSSNTTSNNSTAGIQITNNASNTFTASSNTLSGDNTSGGSPGGFYVINNGTSLTITMNSNSSSPAVGYGYAFQNNNSNPFTINFFSNGGGNNSGSYTTLGTGPFFIN